MAGGDKKQDVKTLLQLKKKKTKKNQPTKPTTTEDRSYRLKKINARSVLPGRNNLGFALKQHNTLMLQTAAECDEAQRQPQWGWHDS